MIGAMRPGSERWSHPLVRATPPQLAGSGGQLLDTASAVSQSLHDLKAPRTVKFAPRRTPTHPAAALSAALSKCSPFWVALPRRPSRPIDSSRRRERSWREGLAGIGAEGPQQLCGGSGGRFPQHRRAAAAAAAACSNEGSSA